mmetsp:Transcript_122335/g.212287  ORF Transcript_122335/g.212287 Transcript_122335/m.212287 type:complete len:133 (+) Transcript_122335:212-610(+)
MSGLQTISGTTCGCPRGLAYFIAFTLAALRCCGDEKLHGTMVLERLRDLRLTGATPEDISLEAGDAVKKIREALLTWPAEEDVHLLSSTSEILEEFMQDERAADDLWDDVRVSARLGLLHCFHIGCASVLRR